MRTHGTKARYSLDGCRCAACRAAAVTYERDRRRRIEPAYVDAGPARDHLAALSAQGVGWKRAAIAAGLYPSTVWKLLYGDPGRGRAPSKRIRRSTLDAILSVSLDVGAPGSRVPAGPTWAAIDRLVAAGVPKSRIAERIGQTGPGLQVGRQYVTRRVRDAIAGMAAELDAGTPARRRPEVAPAFPILDLADWLRDAACRGRPTWMWFPEPDDEKTTAAALRVCGACPVRAECLAANRDETDGIYGGTTSADRATQEVAA